MPQYDPNSEVGMYLKALPIIGRLAQAAGQPYTPYPPMGAEMNVQDHPDNNLSSGSPGMSVMPTVSIRSAGITQNQGGQG